MHLMSWAQVLSSGVVVNDIFFRIEYMPPDSDEGRAYLGRFDSNRSVISLRADLTEDAAKNTLLHEVIHAAFWMGGGGSVPKKKFEEFACTMLPSFLVRFRMDNPKVWSWIFDHNRDINGYPRDAL